MANGFDTSEESYVDDDPVAGFDFNETTQSFDVADGTGYGSRNIDTGSNETTGNILSQAGFNQAMGITATNPFPNSFFSQLFGPENVSYAGMGIDIPGIANLAYDRYRNPFGDTTGVTKVEDLKLREGLSEGEKTRFGEVVSIDKPQTTGQTIARTIFGLGSPLGPIASLIGKDQLALAPDNKTGFKGSPNYDPKLDPNSPEYVGPQSLLGGIGRTLEELTFGGARPVTKAGQGIMDLIQGQKAKEEMKNTVDQTGNNLQLVPSNQEQKISTDLKYVSPKLKKTEGEPIQNTINEMMFDAMSMKPKYAFDLKEIDASDFQPGGVYSAIGNERSGNYRTIKRPDGGLEVIDIGI